MSIVTEIVTMRTVPGITEHEFEEIVDALEREFHSMQEGFIDTELLYDSKAGEWVMVQHWSTPELQKTASRKMFQSKDTEVFVKALDPKSVKMRVLPQMGTWRQMQVPICGSAGDTSRYRR